jgi:hypothetical protein
MEHYLPDNELWRDGALDFRGWIMQALERDFERFGHLVLRYTGRKRLLFLANFWLHLTGESLPILKRYDSLQNPKNWG